MINMFQLLKIDWIKFLCACLTFDSRRKELQAFRAEKKWWDWERSVSGCVGVCTRVHVLFPSRNIDVEEDIAQQGMIPTVWVCVCVFGWGGVGLGGCGCVCLNERDRTDLMIDTVWDCTLKCNIKHTRTHTLLSQSHHLCSESLQFSLSLITLSISHLLCPKRSIPVSK